MAINIVYRPRIAVYDSGGSPSVQVYSNWNSSDNKGACVYGFGIVTDADRQSTIDINIYEVASNTLLSTSRHRPYKIGTFYVDIASFIRPYLNNTFDPDFDGERNKKDIAASIRFYITFRQTYSDGTQELVINDSNYPFFLARCARQYGESSNLSEYVMFPDQVAEEGKFLTKFTQPRKWIGYDRTVSFIWDNYIRANGIVAVQKDYNINGTEIDTNSESLDVSAFNGINIMTITDPTDPLARYTDLSLVAGPESGLGYVEEGYVDDGYTTIV